jgi:hypothetical protein
MAGRRDDEPTNPLPLPPIDVRKNLDDPPPPPDIFPLIIASFLLGFITAILSLLFAGWRRR